MDGYAFSFESWKQHTKLKISVTIPAGSHTQTKLEPFQAARIFTGAPVPPGADTVVMQEKTTVANGELIIDDTLIAAGANVRSAGAEIRAGELALSKNALLTPAAIGFLTAIGIVSVMVYPSPAVSIIVTGDELQQPGKPLLYGQVYESNSIALKSALQQFHINDISVFSVQDNLAQLTDLLRQAIAQSDVVFLTGGISVGDFDFVLQASINNGVQQLFHKIKQRPAKPLYFGKKKNTYIFGLPGNPASGLTSFYEYAAPLLGRLVNRNLGLQVLMAPLEAGFKKPAGLTHFLKGWFNGQSVAVLGAQESYRLSSFAKANCLVQVAENVTTCAEGELVEIHLLPT